MWHSLVLLILCTTTNWFQFRGIDSPWPYLLLWIGGTGDLGADLLGRSAAAPAPSRSSNAKSPTFGRAVVASISLFGVEWLLDLKVLTLSPVLGLINGMVFAVKAGILTGSFYVQAASLFASAALMCLFPTIGLTLFGIISALCFFIPGLKYYRESMRGA